MTGDPLSDGDDAVEFAGTLAGVMVLHLIEVDRSHGAVGVAEELAKLSDGEVRQALFVAVGALAERPGTT